MLPYEGSSVLNLHRAGLEILIFTNRPAEDTINWHLIIVYVVFAYRDRGSGLHAVALSLSRIAVKWFKFSN